MQTSLLHNWRQVNFFPSVAKFKYKSILVLLGVLLTVQILFINAYAADFKIISSGVRSMIYSPQTKVATAFVQIIPYVPNVKITIKMLNGSATFSGGSPSLSINTSDFLDKKTGKYYFEVELIKITHACYTISWLDLSAPPLVTAPPKDYSSLLAIALPGFSGGYSATPAPSSSSSGSSQNNVTPIPGLAYDSVRRFQGCSPGRVCATGGGPPPEIAFSGEKLQGILGKSSLINSLGVSLALPFMVTPGSIGGISDPVVSSLPELTCVHLQPVTFPDGFSPDVRVVEKKWDVFKFIGNDNALGKIVIVNNIAMPSIAQITSKGTGTQPFFPATHKNVLYVTVSFPDHGVSFFNKEPMVSQATLTSFPPVNKKYSFATQYIDFYATNDPNGSPVFTLRPSAFFDDGKYSIDVDIKGVSLVKKSGINSSTRLKWSATLKNNSKLPAIGYLGLQASYGSGAIALIVDNGIMSQISIPAGGTQSVTGYVDYLPGYGVQNIELTLSCNKGQRGYSTFYYNDTIYSLKSIRQGSETDGVDNNLDGVVDDIGEKYQTPGAQ